MILLVFLLEILLTILLKIDPLPAGVKDTYKEEEEVDGRSLGAIDRTCDGLKR